MLEVSKNSRFADFVSLYTYTYARTIKHLIIKPFDLLNTILLTRTKALVNKLLMSNIFNERATSEHKSRTNEIQNEKTENKIPQKLVYEKFYVQEKILRTRKFIKNLLPEKRKENT